MIEIPRHRRYDEWSTKSYKLGKFPCVICGKSVNMELIKHRVYMANDGEHLLSIKEAAQDPHAWEELGQWPIGPDCMRMHPELKDYIVQVEKK